LLGDLRSAPLFLEPLFLEKFLEKMRSRAGIEMAFIGMSKLSSIGPASLQHPFRKLPGEVPEKFQIFSDTLPKNIFFCGTRLI
jgi:hypothetical protein